MYRPAPAKAQDATGSPRIPLARFNQEPVTNPFSPPRPITCEFPGVGGIPLVKDTYTTSLAALSLHYPCALAALMGLDAGNPGECFVQPDAPWIHMGLGRRPWATWALSPFCPSLVRHSAFAKTWLKLGCAVGGGAHDGGQLPRCKQHFNMPLSLKSSDASEILCEQLPF